MLIGFVVRSLSVLSEIQFILWPLFHLEYASRLWRQQSHVWLHQCHKRRKQHPLTNVGFVQVGICIHLKGPDNGRAFPNSTMIGITMEGKTLKVRFVLELGLTFESEKGINQNEFIYEFFLEKSWRHTLNVSEISDW